MYTALVVGMPAHFTNLHSPEPIKGITTLLVPTAHITFIRDAYEAEFHTMVIGSIEAFPIGVYHT